jgi:hypothetical protein
MTCGGMTVWGLSFSPEFFSYASPFSRNGENLDYYEWFPDHLSPPIPASSAPPPIRSRRAAAAAAAGPRPRHSSLPSPASHEPSRVRSGTCHRRPPTRAQPQSGGGVQICRGLGFARWWLMKVGRWRRRKGCCGCGDDGGHLRWTRLPSDHLHR